MFRTWAVTIWTLIFCTSLLGQSSVDSIGIEELSQVVVTAQMVPTNIRQTVNTVKVIDRVAIESRGVTTLTELLQAESNIRITQDAVLGSSMSVNGISGQNVKILLDGIPIAGRLGGNIDMSQIPLTDIQRIEIVEGAQSVIYGSDASGGVINLITQRSLLKPFQAKFNSIYESNGFKTLNGQLGFQRKKFTLNLSSNLQKFDPAPDSVGQRAQYWNPKDQFNVRGSVRYFVSENTEVRITGGTLNEKITDLGELRRLQFKPYAFDDIYLTNRKDGNVFIQTAKPKKWLSQASLRLSSYDRIDNAYRYEVERDTSLLIPMLQDTNLSSAMNIRWIWATDRPKSQWNLMAGSELNTESATGSRLATGVETGQKVSFYEAGLFASLRYNPMKTLALQSGMRWVKHQNFGSAFVPSIWVSYRPSQRPLAIKASASYGYRSPSLEELYFRFVDINHFVIGNQVLQPEKSINIKSEISYTLKSLDKWTLDLSGSAFYNDIDNRIILANIGDIKFQYLNLENWKSLGFAINASGTWNDRWMIKTSFQRSGFYNMLSNTVSDIPTYGWSIDWANEVTYHILADQKLSVNLWHKLTGETPYFFVDKEGKAVQTTLPGWNLLNASIKSSFLNKKLSLQAGVKNIANVRTLDFSINTANHTELGNQQNILWGRTWFVGATVGL